MLRWLYNILLLAGLILALPLLLVKALKVPGYTDWIARRLGWHRQPLARPEKRSESGPGQAAEATEVTGAAGVADAADANSAAAAAEAPCIWLHALSVGETVSALPLLRALRQRYPRATLVLSSSTRAGAARALADGAGLFDRHLVLPYDLPWLSARLVRELRPDLFILVETDFWPNLLGALRASGARLMLVNGRLSAASWHYYRWLRPLLRPLCFAPFSLLAMQSAAEAERLCKLGVDPARVGVMGNLKYPAAQASTGQVKKLTGTDLGLAPDGMIWVAGSTHAGEEEVILRAFRRLRDEFPRLSLVLAPRRVERAAALAAGAGCRAGLYSELKSAAVEKMAAEAEVAAGAAATREAAAGMEVIIVDRYGELPTLYALADVVFIGGSLVPAGGHNPLEAAVWQKKIFFGPHMDDFAEISQDLLAVGGACRVADEEELLRSLRRCLADPAQRAAAGQQAGELLVSRGRGVIEAHLLAIGELL